MSALARIDWHETALDPKYAYEVIKASGAFLLIRFDIPTLPWESGSNRETRFILAESRDPRDLDAASVFRCTSSTADEKAALALYSALLAGLAN